MKSIDTKEDGKLAMVPKLRFPEFQRAEGWKAISLNKLAVRVKQKNSDEKIVRVLTNSAEFGVMDQRDYFDKDIATQGKLNGYFVVEVGDYVYNPRVSTTAPVGPISKNNIATGVMSPLYTVFKFKDHNNDFYAHYFKTTGWHAYLRQASSTGARHDRMAISSDDFIAMPVPTASPEEQQKIAECLNSVDELIGVQARKLDALKTHKKGLMHHLFPREGETQPRLRFPKFQDAGEWELKKLEEITDLVFDGTHQTPTYTPKGVPFYSVENLISGNANKFVSYDDYLFATKKNRPEKGDVLITRIGKIGYTKVVTWDHEFSVYVTLAVIKQSKMLESHFLSYFMQSDFYQSELRAKSLPNAVPPKINLDSLRATAVLLTKEDEQKQIAACFSALDDLIAAQTQKLTAFKTLKKGLMQQLYPSLEEVEA